MCSAHAPMSARRLKGSRPTGADRTIAPCRSPGTESPMSHMGHSRRFTTARSMFALPSTLPALCRASSKTSTMPSAAIRRSDTRAPSSLRSNTPGRWPIKRHHTCPLEGVHSTDRAGCATSRQCPRRRRCQERPKCQSRGRRLQLAPMRLKHNIARIADRLIAPTSARIGGWRGESSVPQRDRGAYLSS